VSIIQHLLSAWQALIANKLRSSLTILGIVIGVGAVVFLVSFGRGQTKAMTSIFENMGVNAIYVTSTSQITGAGRIAGVLTTEDADAIASPNKISAVKTVAPMFTKGLKVVYNNQIRTINVIGSVPALRNILNYKIARGNFLNDQDVHKYANVAILGKQAASDLFGAANPIGETIRVGGRKFDVIGVTEERGSFMGGGNADNFILVPLTTMQTMFGIPSSALGHPVQAIVVDATSTSAINTAKDQITQLLKQRHHIREDQENDFNVIDMQEVMKRMQQSMAIFQTFIASVASISLLVGGIGIMNIMLVSVTERTKEIGIRKAIGAKRRDILFQFLVESSFLSLTGGIAGLLLAVIGSFAVTGQKMNNLPVTAPISPDIVLMAFMVAIFTGVVSGTYPAFRAAKLDPIESLRHE